MKVELKSFISFLFCCFFTPCAGRCPVSSLLLIVGFSEGKNNEKHPASSITQSKIHIGMRYKRAFRDSTQNLTWDN